MSVDFSTVLTDFDGNSIKENDIELTVGKVAVRALIAPFEDEQRLSVDEKFARGKLADRIYHATEPLDLKSEDVTRLKLVVGKAFTPYIVFRVLPLIDPAEANK